MKKFYFTIILSFLYFQNFSQTIIPVSDEILLPQYMINGAITPYRTPLVARLKLTGLNANSTYKYHTSAHTSAVQTTGGPGNMFIINNTANSFGNIVGHATGKAFTAVAQLLTGDVYSTSGSNFGEFTTESDGSYTGWFSVQPSGNAVFGGGNDLYMYVNYNNGVGTTITGVFRTTSTIKSLVYNNIVNTTSCSAITATSTMPGETFVMLYENASGSGRPLIGTWTESDGIATPFTAFNTLTTTGTWSSAIPNNLPNGFNKVSYIDITGTEISSQSTTGGNWNGSNTANLINAVTVAQININPAPASSAKTVNFFILEGGNMGTISGLNIFVNVPSGTSLLNLTAGGLSSSFSTVNPSFNTPKDYTNPVLYTVTAQNLSMQTYTVSVNVLPSTSKMITSFTLEENYAGTISGNTINISVPFGTSINNLTASGVISNLATVNPSFATAKDYSLPVVYTVTAQNMSMQTYTVSVNILPLISDAKMISSFTLEGNYAGTISGNNINISVPFGTSISNLTASGLISNLATVNPSFVSAKDYSLPVVYTVTAQNLSMQTYTVSVNVSPSLSGENMISSFMLEGNYAGTISGNTINVSVPFGTSISNLTASGMISNLATVNPRFSMVRDYSLPVTFTVTAENLSTNVYNVSVSILVSVLGTSNLFFSEYVEVSTGNAKFLEIYNPNPTPVDLLSERYTTRIYSNGNTTVSGTGTTTLTGIIPAFGVYIIANSPNNTITGVNQNQFGSNFFNGNDAVALVKNGVIVDVIGQIGNNPGTEWVGSSVSTLDQTLVRKSSVCQGDNNGTDAFNPSLEWINIGKDVFTGLGSHLNNCIIIPILSNEKELSSFTLQGNFVGTISGNTINISVPFGTSINNLTASGVISNLATVNPSFAIAKDYTLPVVYTVTAQNLSMQTYTVSVNVLPSTSKMITSFTLEGNYAGIISASNIRISVPFGTSISNLSASGIISDLATVNPSFAIAKDYTLPVVYTVTAQNLSMQTYTVSVNVSPSLSGENMINSFTLEGNYSSTISGNTINISVPFGTSISNLTASGLISDLSTVNPSFATAKDYTLPVVYTVTAQNLSTIVYTVTVTELSSLTGLLGVLKTENNVYLYPNPAENEVTIEGINSNEAISIYNGIGTLIFKTVSTDSKIIVNTQFFASGIYFVKFDFSKKVLKLLIKK